MVEEYKWKGIKAPHNPRTTEYDLIERYIKRLAEVSGYEPRQIVSMLWSGIKTEKGVRKSVNTKEVLIEAFG